MPCGFAPSTESTVDPFIDTPAGSAANLPMLELRDAMKNYYSLGLSPATQQCYRAGLKQYTAFCLHAHLPIVPASEHTLLLFATHLALKKLAYPTIKVYMVAVRSVHVNTGNHVIFDKQLIPHLDLLMRGI